MDDPIRVGIGLIRRGGCFLIRGRPPLPGSPMPGLWEFPGGKCEPGETPEGATIRECLEEAGLAVRVVGLRQSLVHRYPHGLVELNYYDCAPEDASAVYPAGGGFAWVEAGRLPDLPFPEANAPLLRELAEESRRAGGPPPDVASRSS
jgi:8-oxo-dGTP diphosphatase